MVTELNKILELRKNKAPTSFLEAKRARIQHKQKADRAKTDEGDDELRPTSLKWKRTILILEMLQQKKKIKNIQVDPLYFNSTYQGCGVGAIFYWILVWNFWNHSADLILTSCFRIHL